MVNFLLRIWHLFACDHNWVWVKNVEDRNLRAGYNHWSSATTAESARRTGHSS